MLTPQGTRDRIELVSCTGWLQTRKGNTMKKNTMESSYIPTAELEAAIERFEDTIEATFGDKAESVCHFLWDSEYCFTTVKVAGGTSVGYSITPDHVGIGSFSATDKEALFKAFNAFGIALPAWL